jgi:recombination protein RecA
METFVMTAAKSLTVKDLKAFLIQEKGLPLLSPDQLHQSAGLPTHCSELDSFLIWKGLPLSAVSLFYGSYGLGGTRLWLNTALPLIQKGHWVAWMNSPECQLTPWFFQQHRGDLSKLVLISSPSRREEWFWALEETLSLSLFELIGFSLGPWTLTGPQVLKLHQLTRRYRSAVVLLSQQTRGFISPFYTLVVKFGMHTAVIERARHHATPKVFKRRQLYADFMPQLAKGRQALRG